MANKAFVSIAPRPAAVTASLTTADETTSPDFGVPAALLPSLSVISSSSGNEAYVSPIGDATQPAKRIRKKKMPLAAVNGVVIPSRIASGSHPNQGLITGQPPASQDFHCSICNRGFALKDRVRQHFPVCVNRNGNPYGLKWDDPHTSSDPLPLLHANPNTPNMLVAR